MNYAMSFGKLSAPAKPWRGPAATFALAVMGDFSGRANRGQLETGSALAARKPRRVDVDNLDDVLASMKLKLTLPIGDEGAAIEIPINSIDVFHPDQLHDNVECFAELATLRRSLAKASTFAAAAAEVRSWGIAEAQPRLRPKPRGSALPSGKLSDFARLVGKSSSQEAAASADELIKQVVRPYVSAKPDPDQAELTEAVDAALSGLMRRILHHPDFQTMEALWRSADLLVRQLPTDGNLQIILYDISAEEVAADLSSAESLDATGLYQLFVEHPAHDTRTAPPAVIVGNYMFEQTPPHADLLGRIAKIAAAARAPFIAAIGCDALEKKKPEEIHPLVTQSWQALRQLPHAAYLGLTVPRFMLRWPYGAKTEAIDPFDFEEFTPQFGLKGFLWANGANLAGLMLGRTYSEQGMAGMKLGTIMVQGDLPLYYYTDSDGDQVALPSTERLVTESVAVHAMSQGLMPIVSLRGRNEVRLGSLQSIRGQQLAGPWGVVEIAPDGAVSAPPAVAAAPAAAPAPAPAVSGVVAPAAAAESADDDLDSLLGDLEDTAAQSSAGAAGAAVTADDDLDALLASLETNETEESASDDGEMDADLAALLAEL